MKRAAPVKILSAVGLALALIAGCHKQQSDADAIRSGITSHLASLKTLSLSSMDVDVAEVSIQGTQAHAQVSFRPKAGAPQGASMQVSYQLEKHDGQWVVTKTEAAGGVIVHPAPGANPHQQPDLAPAHGQAFDLQHTIARTAPGAKQPIPPGHPPIAPASQPGKEPVATTPH
ncbi:MAG: hypothetical protein WBP79_16430 [Candidatus Acidiferrales bacterium]